jgi:hypothetical protein
MAKTRRFAAAAALVATISLLSAVSAERPAQAGEQGTSQERQACTPDVVRFCKAFIPNTERIIVCLQQNISSLSPACRGVISAGVLQ